MATGEEVPNVRTTRTPSEDHGFTQDWVDNHTTRVAQRQLEVHDNPNGQPRTQIRMQEEEERKLEPEFKLKINIYLNNNFRWGQTGSGRFYFL